MNVLRWGIFAALCFLFEWSLVHGCGMSAGKAKLRDQTMEEYFEELYGKGKLHDQTMEEYFDGVYGKGKLRDQKMEEYFEELYGGRIPQRYGKSKGYAYGYGYGYGRAKSAPQGSALTCNKCSVGILGRCLIPDSVECDASMPNCYTGKAEFPSISGFLGLNTQGCLDSASCNSTTNGTILGARYTVTRTCCVTDNCNPVVTVDSGTGSVQLSLTAAASAALVAIVWGSWQY